MLDWVKHMFTKIGMRKLVMEAKAHDLHAAYVSHISHITSFALANTVLEKEKDEEAILEGCEWVRHYGQLSEERLRVYRCIETLIGLEEMEGFDTVVPLLYGESTLQLAQALLAGEACFFGLNALGGNFEGSAMHQRLLAAYSKVQVAKAG